MSKHKFHGDPARFEEVTNYIASHFKNDVKFVADVAGGQGMLARQLNKRGYYRPTRLDNGWCK